MVLLDQRVLRLDQDALEGSLRLFEGGKYRQATNELRDQVAWLINTSRGLIVDELPGGRSPPAANSGVCGRRVRRGAIGRPASDSRALSGTVKPNDQRHAIRYRTRRITRRRDPAQIAGPAARSLLPKRSSRSSRRSAPSARYAAACSAAMVKKQVRAEDVVDVLEAQAGGAETVEPGRLLEKPTTVDTPRTLSAYRTARRSSTRVRSFPASLGLR
jgi:hypothetical protein